MRDPAQAPQVEEHVLMIEGVRFEDEGLGPRHDQGEEHEQDRDAGVAAEDGPAGDRGWRLSHTPS